MSSAGDEWVFSSDEDAALYRDNGCHRTFGPEDRKSGGIKLALRNQEKSAGFTGGPYCF
jgi:hypothetical protein